MPSFPDASWTSLMCGKRSILIGRLEWDRQCGLALNVLSASNPGVAAVVLLLCDQPHVTPSFISSLIAAHHIPGKPIIASAYGGSFGVPVLFSRALFTELTQLGGRSGAKEIIERHTSETHFLTFSAGEVDVDTPDDFSFLLGETIEP